MQSHLIRDQILLHKSHKASSFLQDLSHYPALGASAKLNFLSYNIHKGFNLRNTQYTLELIKKGIQETNCDILCLQEVCGLNLHPHKEKIHPLQTQFEFLADGAWPHHAYGKNAEYKSGHHGNAILSKYPIVESLNLDISTNAMEQRGLLHVKLQLAEDTYLHVMTTHLNLLAKGRLRQSRTIANYIQQNIPSEEALVLAGDFNDWKEELSSFLKKENNLDEVYLDQFKEHAKSFPSFAPFLKLDRIYFRNMKALKALCLLGEPWSKLSDHNPLYAKLSLLDRFS
ncbi:MAG: endonuclease/exonuclease/phosphatase family protein [Bdellovibrionota bacterium]